jgi:nitrate/TMAO reductase-like tetraheme cytochrome c subunit
LQPRISTLAGVRSVAKFGFGGIALAFAVLAACSSDGDPEPSLSLEARMDPASCAGCHPSQVEEWSGSMHAYAGEDPVFLAMNARMQRETQGRAKDFCVRCHAPVALRMGKTQDGTNLAEVPKALKGVTCYFCHSVDAVTGSHSAELSLSDDGVMRGGLPDPVKNGAHRSAYSPLHDRERIESASLCGTCHDIVALEGAHVERTFDEWKKSLYARTETGQQLTCGKCHMDSRSGRAATTEGAPVRRVHNHALPSWPSCA